MLGQFAAAVLTCSRTRRATVSVLSLRPVRVGKQRLARLAAALGDPDLQHGAGGFGDRHGPVLAALAEAAHERAGAEADIRTVQSGDLGYA